jgi:hypothetical protein
MTDQKVRHCLAIPTSPVQEATEGYFPPDWFDLVQECGNVIADDIDDKEYKRKKDI